MTSLSGAPSGSQLNLSFVYDYQGRRIQKLVLTNSGSAYVGEYTNNYVYDGWNCLAILNPSLGLVESFMWGSDLSGTIQGAGGVGGLIKVTYYASTTTNCFVAFDGNGNVSALVNAANGVTVANYDYGPFGELIRASGPMAKLNPFRFSTKYDDDESDFLYYGHRYYNPSTGRFISRDPIAEKGGINLYILANNNPLIRVDAFGLDFDPSPYSWLAQAYSWFMTEIVNQVFVKTTLIHDVSCPPGSSRYLLARHEHIVREKSHVVVTLFGIDFVNQTAVKPIMDAVEETYGCCGGCGLFAFNTTSWTYQETQSSGADQGGDKSFGPANLEYTLQTITQDKDKKRQCVNSVSPSWSWNEFDGN
jgi:RHS repeat-associated protein